jgi:hypothetical protein
MLFLDLRDEVDEIDEVFATRDRRERPPETVLHPEIQPDGRPA